MAMVIVEHKGLGARVALDEVAAPGFAPKGWVVIGPWDGHEGSTLTDAEWAGETAPPRRKKTARSTTPTKE